MKTTDVRDWPQIVVAVDPGGAHNGVTMAAVKPDAASLIGAWEFQGEYALLDRFESWAKGGSLMHLVYEEYRLYPWQARNQNFSDLPVPQVIGALRWISRKYRIPATPQKAAIMKGARKTAEARGLPMVDRSLGSGKGAYRGPDFDPKWLRDLFGVKSSQHTRDALAHLCHWVWTNEAAPAGRWRGKAHEAPTREQVLRGALLSLPQSHAPEERITVNAYEHHFTTAERLLTDAMPRMGGNRDSPSEREQMIGRAQAHALLAVAAATKAAREIEDFADAARQAARKRADEAETALMRCAEALAERWAADNGIDDAGVWIAHRRSVAEAAYEAVLNGLDPGNIDFGTIVHALEQ